MHVYRSYIQAIGLILLLVGTAGSGMEAAAQPEPRLLVFSKTAGFRHSSIEPGIAALQAMGREHGFAVDTTEDATRFNETNLKQYQAVVFLNTTGDVLNQAQQNDFERFIQAGGGFVGVHAATDTEYDWPWYGELVGAYFNGHPNNPNVQPGTFHVVDPNHPATEGLPEEWQRADEFYNFKEINPDLNVLVTIDEQSYNGGTNGDFHPMAWYHNFDGGRSFYTNLGHTDESFAEPLYLQHLLGGIRYALGGETPVELNYYRSHTPRVPEENRFAKVVLGQGLNEPMELAVLPGERILFIERHGTVKLYRPETDAIEVIATIPVSHEYRDADGEVSEAEDGLVGLAADPDFADNGWIYLYYSQAGDEPVNILTRYEMHGDELLLESKQVLLEVPVQREQCCHTGGSIAFDAAGNLYLSTGDNTNPHGTGYAPIDERPGRSPWDAQKSSANTNDLRGKILRIHPEPDGSYTIPEGNLFPPGTPDTRPEIYTMGHRNPYRISVDPHTGFVYWGDVGPDASRDSVGLGPAGHDEFGQAREAGNFGWPLFVGDNKAYHDYDFATGEAGEAFDPAHPVNHSPNNTGLQELPPAQKAFLWYPAAPSDEFPQLGSGGRSAMAGPVFYAADFRDAERSFPEYYDGKLFIYEWMRGWIMAVTMDEKGDYVSMEPFMPSYRFSNPIEMAFAPSGDLYLLEYGTGWFQANDDARLVRIEYTSGNRMPVAAMTADRTAGATPLQVNLSSEGSTDYDGDPLSYAWTITSADGASVASFDGPGAAYTIETPGVYTASLTVTDTLGEASVARTEIVAGNEPPEVEIRLVEGNRSFFIAGTPIAYEVHVADREDGGLEDGGIRPEQVAVTFDYMREGFDQAVIAQGHRTAEAAAGASTGQALIESGDCRSCHELDGPSIGPSYTQVAARYKDDPNAAGLLASKVIEGGSGVWGDVVMPPHPLVTPEEATRMAAFILSLADEATANASLPVAGDVTPTVPAGAENQGAFILRAAYTDQGASGVPAQSSEDVLVLRSPMIAASETTIEDGIQRFKPPNQPYELVIGTTNGASIGFEQIDLTGIQEIAFMAAAPSQGLPTAGGHVEVRLDAPDGTLIGTSTPITPAPGFGQGEMLRAEIEPTTGPHDLYFVYRNDQAAAQQPLFILLTIHFATEASPETSSDAGAGPAGPSPGTAEAGSGSAGLSIDSTLRELFANVAAKAVLERHVPGMTTHPQIGQAMDMTLREIAPYAPDTYTDQVLQAINEELAAL